MREMIASLVGEGRTVMLSSHLLDEVERTCDAVAIVDHGRVVRQGSIDELVRGAGNRSSGSTAPTGGRGPSHRGDRDSHRCRFSEQGLTVTLPAGASRETVAEVNRRLVAGGISVYSLQEVQTPWRTGSCP